MIGRKTCSIIAEAALREAFESRFKAIVEAVTLEMRAAVSQQHPTFCQLMADPDARQYLYVCDECVPVCGDDARLFVPDRYQPAGERNTTPVNWPDWVSLVRSPISRPAAVGVNRAISAELENQYLDAWRDLCAAAKAVDSALSSVRNLRQLHESFPELAKYAPAETTPAALPVLPVDDLRAQLQAYGVGK